MSQSKDYKQTKELKENKEEKKPKSNVAEKKRKSRNSYTLHTNALLYLLLKKGFTIKLVKTKTSKMTLQNYKCIELHREMQLIEEHMNEADLNELSSYFDDLVASKSQGNEKTITLEAQDILPVENSSETVSDE